MQRTVKREFRGALGNALTVCRTVTLRAYRTASMETYRANDDLVKGWIWTCAHQARTCAACWGMDGTFHKLTEELTDHPNGRCVAVPVTKSWSEITGKPAAGAETSVQPWDAEEKFRKLRREDQVRVLGPTRYALWSQGKIGLRDIPTKERSQVWGNHYRPKTLNELVKSGNVSAADIVSATPGAISGKRYTSIIEAMRFVGESNTVMDSARETAAVIDSIHGVSKLRRIDVRFGSADGAYGYYDRLGAPREIMIGNSWGMNHPHPIMTQAHEIGHWLDDQAIGNSGRYASETSSLLDKWRKAVDNTDAIKALRQGMAGAPNPGQYRYLLTGREMFARSYAQYIATKSKNSKMLAELNWMRQDPGHLHRQWNDQDFDPVADAFDGLLRKLKWLK